MDIQLDTPALDYITYTTWDYKDAYQIRDIFERWEGEGQSASRMQYNGRSYAGGRIFIGHGEIEGRYHGMVVISGSLCEKYRWIAMRKNPLGKLTRLDVQVTVECDRINMVSVGGVMKSLSRRKIGLVVSGDWDGTLYIGSRKSDKLIRIYIKKLENDRFALRFEVEYKGKRSDQIRKMLSREGKLQDVQFAGLLLKELKSVMFVGIHEFDYPISRMRRLVSDITDGGEISPKVARLESNTIVWLETQVRQAVIRLANDHDTDMERLRQWAFSIIGDIDIAND